MQALRKKLRSLRWVIWFALAFALFGYVVKPLKAAFWDDGGWSTRLCDQARSGGDLRDKFGREYRWVTPGKTLLWVGPDGMPGGNDDILILCDSKGR